MKTCSIKTKKKKNIGLKKILSIFVMLHVTLNKKPVFFIRCF